MSGQPTASDARAALTEAWTEVTGWVPNNGTLNSLLAAGWTVEHIHRVHRLAQHARACQTGVHLAEPGSTILKTASWLTEIARFAMSRTDLDIEEMLEWLTVLVASPDPNVAMAFQRLYRTDARTGGPSTDPAATVLRMWRTQLPRQIAPLAWAAGLTPEEAGLRHRTTGLPETELRMLASLRGYRLL
jgi:hypothetical protein